jgi:hypothetical protein
MSVLYWASVLLVGALAVVGCVGPYQGGAYDYGGAYGGAYYTPQNIYANPWVGPNTPWTYFQGDWFLNGMLYNYYGNQYGWAPYYAYPPTYTVRPNNWYGPRWNTWYQQHPQYWQTFANKYPYWRDHRQGQHYDQNFYNRYHRSQGEGWQKGFHGRAIEIPHRQGRIPGPTGVNPREGSRSGPAQVVPHEGQRLGPGQVAPYERQRPIPAQVVPRERQRPGSARIAPSQGQREGTNQVTPRATHSSGGPAQVNPHEEQRHGPAQ